MIIAKDVVEERQVDGHLDLGYHRKFTQVAFLLLLSSYFQLGYDRSFPTVFIPLSTHRELIVIRVNAWYMLHLFY